MKIENDKVVTFHYTLTDAEGSFTETSEARDPVSYLHGHGNIVRGLEHEMRDKQAGDSFRASIPPEHAYGPRSEHGIQRVPIKHLIRPGRLEVGKMVAVNTGSGPRRAWVRKVGRFNVDLDLDHPLAGKTLVFDVRILDVREATPEEIEHGHAHGPGGHGHD